MYCKYCGHQIDDNVASCPNCGKPVQATQSNPKNPVDKPSDNGGFLWGVLGFLSPLIGFILYFCLKKSKPRTATSLSTGATVGLVLIFIELIFFAFSGGCAMLADTFRSW